MSPRISLIWLNIYLSQDRWRREKVARVEGKETLARRKKGEREREREKLVKRRYWSSGDIKCRKRDPKECVEKGGERHIERQEKVMKQNELIESQVASVRLKLLIGAIWKENS